MDKYVFSWDEIHRDSKKLAVKIHETGQWKKIIAITRAGMIPACIVARELNIRDIDTLCIASYDHDHQGDVSFLKKTDGFGDGEGYLIIDDIVDTGNTFEAIRRHLPNAYYTAIYTKKSGLPVTDDFGELIHQDVWYDFPWDMETTLARPLIESFVKRTLVHMGN